MQCLLCTHQQGPRGLRVGRRQGRHEPSFHPPSGPSGQQRGSMAHIPGVDARRDALRGMLSMGVKPAPLLTGTPHIPHLHRPLVKRLAPRQQRHEPSSRSTGRPTATPSGRWLARARTAWCARPSTTSRVRQCGGRWLARARTAWCARPSTTSRVRQCMGEGGTGHGEGEDCMHGEACS